MNGKKNGKQLRFVSGNGPQLIILGQLVWYTLHILERKEERRKSGRMGKFECKRIRRNISFR